MEPGAGVNTAAAEPTPDMFAHLADMVAGSSHTSSSTPDRKSWAVSEDHAILSGVAEHGRKWKVIAESLPGRTSSSVRNRHHRLLVWAQQQLDADTRDGAFPKPSAIVYSDRSVVPSTATMYNTLAPALANVALTPRVTASAAPALPPPSPAVMSAPVMAATAWTTVPAEFAVPNPFLSSANSPHATGVMCSFLRLLFCVHAPCTF